MCSVPQLGVKCRTAAFLERHVRCCSEAVLSLLQDVIHTLWVWVRQAPCMCHACGGSFTNRKSLSVAGTCAMHATSWNEQAGTHVQLTSVPWSWFKHPNSAAAIRGNDVTFVKRHRSTHQSTSANAFSDDARPLSGMEARRAAQPGKRTPT